MERNLIEREINDLMELPDTKPAFWGRSLLDAEVQLFPKGKFYGYLKEKSFLRKADLVTKQTFKGKSLYYPHKQQVDILGENKGWLLVRGGALYNNNGIDYVYAQNNMPANLEGWVKKSWVDIRQSIPITQPSGQVRDEHVGKVVQIKGKVRAELGIKLHRTPNPATKMSDSKIYPQNAGVTIIGLPNQFNDPNWYKIQTEDGKEGWIESRYVTQIPSADLSLVIKEFYIAKPGDALDPLVASRYPTYQIKTGDDRRTIIHAFSILNNQNPAVYYKGVSDTWWRDHVFDRQMAETRQIYAGIKLRKGGLIYFPTESYINYLKDTGRVGQRPDWKNHAIDFGKAIISFAEGFYDSISKIISDVWDDIKGLFSLSFFKDIYDFIKEVIDNPGILIDLVKAMFQGIESVIRNLTSSIASVKYKAYGNLIGMISGNLVIAMVMPGSSGVKAAGAARKLKVIQKIEKQLARVTHDSKKFDALRKKLIKYTAQQKKWIDKWGPQKAGKIMDVVDNRHKLRVSLGLQVREPRQAHHIIPIDVLKNNTTVQKAVIEGFDFNGAVNGIPVAPKFHLAGHDQIHELIHDEINAWARLHPRASGKEIREFFEKDLIPQWRSKWKEIEKGFIHDPEYILKAAEATKKIQKGILKK